MFYKGAISKALRTEQRHVPGAPCQALESVSLRAQSLDCRATGALVHHSLTDECYLEAIFPPGTLQKDEDAELWRGQVILARWP